MWPGKVECSAGRAEGDWGTPRRVSRGVSARRVRRMRVRRGASVRGLAVVAAGMMGSVVEILGPEYGVRLRDAWEAVPR